MKLHSRHAATAGPVAGLRTNTAKNFAASAKTEEAAAIKKASTDDGLGDGAGTGPQHGLLQV